MTQQSSNNELNGALRPLRSAMVNVALFSGMVNLLMLAGPLFMLQIYDRVLPSRSIPTLVVLCLLVAALYIFLAIFNFIRSTILNRAGLGFEQKLMGSAWRMGLVGSSQGQAPTQPVQDLTILRQFISGNGPAALCDLPWVPIYIGFVFILHTSLGLLTVAGLAVILAVTLANELITSRALRGTSENSAKEQQMRHDCMQNADAILSMGMISNLTAKWQTIRNSDCSKLQGSETATNAMASTIKGFRLLLQSSLLALGAYLAIRQEVSMGAMIAASIVAGRAFSPVDQALGHWRGFVQARLAFGRTKQAFVNSQDVNEPIALPKPNGALELSEVLKLGASGAGAVDAKSKPILQGISLQLNPGDALAVIGPSASGKSTLAQLLTGLQSADRGSILLDGAPYDAWHAEQLGQHIGYLPQKVQLLAGTIKDNIARFDPNATDQEILQAARLAGAHEIIMRLPGGYGAQIGNGGFHLSGGQAQRIALARAVFRNPSLVVLDEPNSNLDADGDEALAQCVKALRNAGTITMVVTHRPSAMKNVNMVLVLKEGRQVKFGPVSETQDKPAVTQPLKMAG